MLVRINSFYIQFNTVRYRYIIIPFAVKNTTAGHISVRVKERQDIA